MEEFVALRAKTYTYLMDDVVNVKKQKEQKSSNKKRKLWKLYRLLVQW